MNSISVAQMASWQFDERIRKEMLHQDKSRYSAAEDDTHRLVILFFFFLPCSLLTISSRTFDYYTEEVKLQSSYNGRNENLFSRVTDKKHRKPRQEMLHNKSLLALHGSLSC